MEKPTTLLRGQVLTLWFTSTGDGPLSISSFRSIPLPRFSSTAEVFSSFLLFSPLHLASPVPLPAASRPSPSSESKIYSVSCGSAFHFTKIRPLCYAELAHA